MTEAKKTEVVEVKSNLPSEVTDNAWGSENTASSDMIIPKIMLMQALSDLVSKGSAVAGDIVESLSGAVIAPKTKPVEIIPILSFKTWMRFELIDNKWVYKEKVPYTLQNADWKYETVENGIQVRNDSCLNFFVLLSQKVEELPCLISFRRSSYYAGKKLSTHFQISAMKKQPPAKKVFSLFSQQSTVDKNTFWTMDLKPQRDATEAELSAAYLWYKTLSHSADKVQVAEAEVEA